MSHSTFIVAVDIGTSNVSTIIAEAYSSEHIEVLGLSSVENTGMKEGKIHNQTALYDTIKQAKEQAEKDYSCTIESVWVSLPTVELVHDVAHTQMNVDGVVTQSHIDQLLKTVKRQNEKQNYEIVNIIPMGFLLDDDKNADVQHAPVGMKAHYIKGLYHLLYLPKNTLESVRSVFKKLDVDVERIIPSNLAAAEYSLSSDEKQYGVCLIDMGASSTNISLYWEGLLIKTATMPSGGNDITKSIIKAYKTTTEEAERLKIENATLDPSKIKYDKMIKFNVIGGEFTASQADINEIIRQSYEMIFSGAYSYLKDQAVYKHLSYGVVLSGQAAAVEGIEQFAQRYLKTPTPVRSSIATPCVTAKDADRQTKLQQKVYYTATGLLLFSQRNDHTMTEGDQPSTGLGRLMNWIFDLFKRYF